MEICNKNIFKVLLALLSSFILAKQFDLPHYTFVFLFFSLLLVLFFIKANTNLTSRKKKYVFILSFTSALIFSIGTIIWGNEFQGVYDIFTFRRIVLLILFFAADFSIAYYSFSTILNKLETFTLYEKPGKFHILSGKSAFLISFFIIFLAYIPYLIRSYPAIMSPDSFVQINSVENHVLSNLHPFVQTWLFGGIYNIGKLIFGKGNAAIAFYIIFQMIVTSIVFALYITFLYKKHINKYVILATLAFYAFSPLHAFYSVTLWKDILFGVNFLAMNLIYIKLNHSGFNFKTICLFTATNLAMIFLRNNGIYILILITPFLIYFYKNSRKTIALICICIISFYYIFTGPIYNAIGVSKTKSTEAFSIPLQQIARVIALDKKIDNESLNYLNEILDLESVKNNYAPHISDPVKNSVYIEKFDETKVKFLFVWAKLFFEHPQVYIEAYFSQTLGYWYPDTVYHAIGGLNAETELYNAYKYGISNTNNLPNYINKLFDMLADKSLPFSYIIWSTGLYCYLLFISIAFAIYNRKFIGKNIVCYLPLIMLWLTMMVASPVFAELRYIYGIFTCLPLALILPFTKEKESNE